MLNQLPPPPPGRTGWPWNEESEILPPLQPDGKTWPRISIVTPNFNQGQFIEETIRSILLQNYPNFEYIVIDGKSIDNSVEIVRKYEKWISYWVSESDSGQSHAINKGFEICTGDLVNWICSDDMLFKNAFHDLIPIIAENWNALIIGRGLRIDRSSIIIDEIEPSSIKNFIELADLGNFWRKGNSIMQQSCLFPLEEVKSAGYLNESNHYTMDYELWGKLLINKVPVVRFNKLVGCFRWYDGQKTSEHFKVTRSLIKTTFNLIKYNRDIAQKTTTILRFKVMRYSVLYYYYHYLMSKVGIKRKFRYLLNVSTGNIHS